VIASVADDVEVDDAEVADVNDPAGDESDDAGGSADAAGSPDTSDSA
jgi:hypothetical protein